jgi:hypothetical protein
MTEAETRIDGRSREARMAREAERNAAIESQTQARQESLAAADIVIETPGGRRVTRDSRKAFGNQSQKLAYPNRVGYHRHWFNDTPGRVAGAAESGYTHVKDPVTGQNVSHVVGVANTGGALTAFLMEIPEEWWRDDMAEQEKVNVAKEEAIKGGAQAKDASDREKFYPTAQGRHIQVTRR